MTPLEWRDWVVLALALFLCLRGWPYWRVRALAKTMVSRHLECVNEFCHDCGVEQALVWTAEDSVWWECAEDHHPLCPECFDRRARKLGRLLRWRPEIEYRQGEEGF